MSDLPYELVNKIIMMARPSYPFLLELEWGKERYERERHYWTVDEDGFPMLWRVWTHEEMMSIHWTSTYEDDESSEDDE